MALNKNEFRMKTIKFLTVAVILTTLVACNNQGVTNKELKTEVDSVSYAMGLSTAGQFKANFDEIDDDLYVQGFKNGLDSANILIEKEKVNDIIRSYMMKKQAEMQKKQQAEAIKKAEADFAEVKKAGETFLAENKTKEGVKATDSGLQYIVLKEGNGAKPVATDKVKVHYHGTLADGTVFDSSVERGTPSEFFANQVIKGWTEGLQLMNVGSKYKFFIPQELGYGATPRQGGKIKPFDALVFEVELLDIVKK